MGIEVSTFGDYQGKRVDQFRLVSDTGVTVDIIGYGVAVRDWRVPVAGGERGVVLGFDSFDAYPAHSPHFGSLAGRVANRIKNASFELDGVTYKLPANAGETEPEATSAAADAATAGATSAEAAAAVPAEERSGSGWKETSGCCCCIRSYLAAISDRMNAPQLQQRTSPRRTIAPHEGHGSSETRSVSTVAMNAYSTR